MQILVWATRIIAAVILLQTLFFKFTAAPESVWIFETLGVGALGRIGSGVIELIVASLLLVPKFTKLGSLGALGVMSGAILSHIFVLGIEVQRDGGLLFILAIIVVLMSGANLFLTREKLQVAGFTI
tara:strand:+ start:246061 stop:246441 length:381 start_codon:yes stop_codon:yes gene_type:complete